MFKMETSIETILFSFVCRLIYALFAFQRFGNSQIMTYKILLVLYTAPVINVPNEKSITRSDAIDICFSNACLFGRFFPRSLCDV